jgi:dephospho-CoA kinase
MSKRWPNKLVIGLTGNIATGKSAIMREAARRGALTIDADQVVHQILEQDDSIQEEIKSAFGTAVALPNGRINRAALGSIVFKDPTSLQKLEAIVHPLVRPRIHQIIATTNASIIMIEAIKLLEGDLVEECDYVWVANCSKFLQLQRLLISRGMDEDHAFERIMAQPPQAEKVARADVVIDTSGPLASTAQQVQEAWGKLSLASGGEMVSAPASEAVEAVAEPVEVPAPVTPEPTPAPEPMPAPAATPAPAPVATEGLDIVVRRARPSDIPSIMLLIHKATNGRVKPKRAEILMSLSERGYLIGQNDGEISTVVGWYADKGFASVEQMYIHPPEATGTTGAAVLQEITKSANELMCEAIFAFFEADEPDDNPTIQLLLNNDFAPVAAGGNSDWPRVWAQTYKELIPPGRETRSVIRRLWNARVA